MSGRFVRKSSYRHVFGEAAKPSGQFLQTPIQCVGDGNHATGNSKFICYSGRGGGGPVIIHDINKPGRMSNQNPSLQVHKGKVLDYAFNPFNENLLATASEDCHVKVSSIPDGGLVEHQTESVVDLVGHEKKILSVKWHPTSNNVLASAGFDQTVKVWDVEAQQCAYDLEDVHTNALHHIAWNRNGSQMATMCKDKTMRFFDPRDQKVVAEAQPFQGSKKSSVIYLSKHNLVAAIGFTRSSMRQIKIYDPRNMSKACSSTDIDQSAGVLCSYYDHDTSILFVGGKGDSSIKYFEIVNTAPYVHFLSEYRDTSSQKGIAFLPKTNCITTKCEIVRCLRVMRDSIVPVSFCVPRKSSDLFQKDIYPDAYAGIAAQEAKDYMAGTDVDPVLTSMRPGERKGQVVKDMVVKKSYAELESELEAANKRIAELEAQLKA